MNIEISPDLVPFVQSVISSGRCTNEAEVVDEALRMFRELAVRREALRHDVLAGFEELDQGKGLPGDDVFQRLEQKARILADQAKAAE